MKTNSKFRQPIFWRIGLGSLLMAPGGLMAQLLTGAPGQAANSETLIANPNPAPPLETEDQQSQPNEMNVFETASQTPQNPLPQIFRYGPVSLQPYMDYSFTFGTGLPYGPGTSLDMVIQQLTLGLVFDLGTHWAFSYSPNFQFYSNDKFHNSANQSLALTGGFEYAGWKFGLSQSVGLSSSLLIATAGQTDQSEYSTMLSASHPVTTRISTDLAIEQDISLVSGFEDSYEWSTMDWLDYEFWARCTAGIGAGGGYVLLENDGQSIGPNNSTQTFEDAQVRFNWRATDKISFQVSGGFEDREFSTAGAGDSLDPIFGMGIEYLPRHGTEISLDANRSVAQSNYYLAAQQVETTAVEMKLSQRLFRRFNLGLGIGYAITDYGTAESAVAAGAADRSDDGVTLSARLSHPFLKRGTLSVFYQYTENNSSQPGFSFASNQFGFDISYHF